MKEKIERLGKYFHSMNVASENNIIYVRVQFPKGWGCSEVTEHNFNVKAVKDEIPGYFYFFASLEVGFDKVFEAIEYNIQFNEEAQAKVALLKDKIEELKDIFENEDINVLKTLEFKYKKKKNIKKSVVKEEPLNSEIKEYGDDTCVLTEQELNNSTLTTNNEIDL